MIKTYLKHFVLDRFLNSIFDGLMNTFDIMPELVIGKKYSMIVFEYKIFDMLLIHQTNPYNQYKYIVENAILCKIDTVINLASFSNGYITCYKNDILMYVNDISKPSYYLPIDEITLIFE